MSIDSFASSSARRRWLRWLAIAAGAFVLLTVLAWLAAPPIARSQLESRLSQALGRKTTVESVEFNPLQLRFTIRKLVIADPAGTAPLLALDELIADLSSASVWRRAPVLDALKLVHPAVSLARDRDGRYSAQDLIDTVFAGPSGPPPQFSLNNIEIDDGSIAFDDGTTGRKHRVEKLAIGIPFLSSLPYQTDIRVTPRFEGAVNGAHFELGGNTIPFAERREAAIDIEFDALPLKDYVAYLPVKPRVELTGGAVTTHLKAVFVDGAPSERKLEVRGDVRVDGLAVKRRDGSLLVAAERIAVALDRVEVFGRDARVASVAVDAPAIDVRRLADGTLELAQPLFDVAADAVARSPAPKLPITVAPEAPWRVTLAPRRSARRWPMSQSTRPICRRRPARRRMSSFRSFRRTGSRHSRATPMSSRSFLRRPARSSSQSFRSGCSSRTTRTCWPSTCRRVRSTSPRTSRSAPTAT
jgi:hypothetical protein